MKPGVAVAIVRDCLDALAALHRHGIVHGDIKPSNIMLKRTGIAKIVDIGSAFELRDPPQVRTCTPAYAAPEVLENRETTPRSDLCSLGYVLIELLVRPAAVRRQSATCASCWKPSARCRCGCTRFCRMKCCGASCCARFIRGMIAPDPVRRFPSAEAADLLKEGAAAFHRQLVIGDLASEYDNDIRLWLEELKELDAQDDLTSEAA